MLAKYIRYLALLSSAFVMTSFGLFAIEETREASAATRTEIAGTGTTRDPGEESALAQAQARKHGDVRRKIDSVNAQLTAPFAGLVHEDQNIWVQRSIPSLLALLVFGLGLGFLSRYAQGRSGPILHHHTQR